MRTEEEKKYLLNKHKGGTANMKGGLYEDFYAVYQIVSCIAEFKSRLNAVSFQTQLEDTYVDDLLIARPEANVYHQLKNTKELSWNTKFSGRSITSDFENQKQDCQDRKERFALKLVYSAINSKVKNDYPTSIKDCTQAEYFPYENDINKLVLISEDMKRSLAAISALGNDSTCDDLVNIATLVLGVWKSYDSKKGVTLLDVVSKLEQATRINLSIYPDMVMSDDCRGILDAIEGLEYNIKGRLLYFRMGHLRGSCPWPGMEQIIIHSHPTNKMELFALINE